MTILNGNIFTTDNYFDAMSTIAINALPLSQYHSFLCFAYGAMGAVLAKGYEPEIARKVVATQLERLLLNVPMGVI